MQINYAFRSAFFFLTLMLSSLALSAQSDYKLRQNFDLGSGRIYVFDVVTDSLNNYFIAGNATGSVTFNSSPPIFVSGGYKGFVAKLDSTSQILWLKYWTSDSISYTSSIALSSLGEVIVGGYLNDDIRTSNILQLNNLRLAGNTNNFVLKLDSSGSFNWVRTFEDPETVYNFSSFGELAVNLAGDIYLTGAFAGQVDFDPGIDTVYKVPATTFRGPDHGEDIFILKLNPQGEYQWARQIGGGYRDHGLALKLDSQENLIVGGTFQDTADFNTGGPNGIIIEPKLFGIIPVGHCFIAKYDSSGNFIWSKGFGGQNTDAVRSLQLDASDNIYAGGRYSDSADMDPGVGIAFTRALGVDGFVQKMDNNGNLLWHKPFGGDSSMDEIIDIGLSKDGRVLATGAFVDSVALNPDSSYYDTGDTSHFSVTGLIELENDGRYKWSQAFADNYVVGVGVGYSDKGTPYVYGGFYDTIDIEPRATLSYEIYSGTRRNGFLFQLEYCPGVKTSIYDTACGYYSFYDSLYFESGTYLYPLLGPNNCDSVIELNLMINVVNNRIVFKNPSTLAAEDSTASYQWYNCSLLTYLPNDTLQYFSPTDNSKYAVLVKNGQCESLSSCLSLNDISNPQFDYSALEIYPNPIGDFLLIDAIGESNLNLVIDVYSPEGRLVKRFKEASTSGRLKLDFKQIPKGVYILNLVDGVSKSYYRVIKK
mgnify:CR=1 FL=1|tara:strand:- start:1423 stop:3537 length:2115 start_codon:yes stop_codon:yes gene_type:complete